MDIRLKRSTTKLLHYTDKHAITNALRVAACQYEDDAKRFRAVEEQGGIKNFMTAKAAARMAEQFDNQVKQANGLVEAIDDAIQIYLDNDEEG